VIVDGGQTLRAFRVMRTHVVQLAVAMGDEGSGRHLFSLCEPAHSAAHVEMSLSTQFGRLQALESPMNSHYGINDAHTLSALAAARAPRPVLEQAGRIILGKEHEIRLALACLLAGGHLLIEDVPGVGKTTLAHAWPACSACSSSASSSPATCCRPTSPACRSSTATPALPLPPRPGVRAAGAGRRDQPRHAEDPERPARSDGGAPGHRRGQTRPLPKPFFVIATQNPAHQIGTFPLPESQLDRFLMRIQRSQLAATRCSARLLPSMPPPIDAALLEASSRAWAWLDGRDMVLPDDVQAVLPAVARHRLRSAQGAAMHKPRTSPRLIRSVAIP
jgi:MoxR-like ATPase